MKIALRSIGEESWVGGIYYIMNLIRAIKTLPPEERAEMLLISASGRLPLTGRERELFKDVLPEVRTFGDGDEHEGQSAQDRHDGAKAPERRAGVAPRISGALEGSPVGRGIKRMFKRGLRDQDDPYPALGAALSAENVDMLFPCVSPMGVRFAVPWVAWAWDLQHKYLPHYFRAESIRQRDEAFTAMARQARIIVTSSADALKDFDRFYPGGRERLRVLRFRTAPEDSWFTGDPRATASRYGLPEKFLMLPNQFWAHKNHRCAFEAMAILKDRGLRIPLVCTGNTKDDRSPRYFGGLQSYLSEQGLDRDVHILGLIPRLDQVQLIRASAAIVQPSLFEGWSSVVEDSRVMGKMLFLSNLTVHLEQDPPGASFFDPTSPAGLADAIEGRWESLRSGPDGPAEIQARQRQVKLVQEYARDFLHIASEASAAPSPV